MNTGDCGSKFWICSLCYSHQKPDSKSYAPPVGGAETIPCDLCIQSNLNIVWISNMEHLQRTANRQLSPQEDFVEIISNDLENVRCSSIGHEPLNEANCINYPPRTIHCALIMLFLSSNPLQLRAWAVLPLLLADALVTAGLALPSHFQHIEEILLSSCLSWIQSWLQKETQSTKHLHLAKSGA